MSEENAFPNSHLECLGFNHGEEAIMGLIQEAYKLAECVGINQTEILDSIGGQSYPTTLESSEDRSEVVGFTLVSELLEEQKELRFKTFTPTVFDGLKCDLDMEDVHKVMTSVNCYFCDLIEIYSKNRRIAAGSCE